MVHQTDLSFSDIQERLERLPVNHLPKYRIAVMRTVTVEAIEPYLRYIAWEKGFNAEICLGQFDNLIQAAMDENGGLLTKETDCVLVYAPLETLSQRLACQYFTLSVAELEAELAHIKSYFASVLAGIRKQTDALILWHGLEVPVWTSLGIFDIQTDNGQTAIVDNLNTHLRSLLRSKTNCYFVDTTPCLVRLGAPKFYDRRYWHLARAPWSREALHLIAREDFKFIAAVKGKSKKCLVLDCDNVLWGGIVGEDDLNGIALGKTYPGSCFQEFQQEVLGLHHRGILIALCSKNNADDVWDVFQNHPEMLLRKEHVIAAQINWDDKPTNLRRIAQTLNIGVDSLVLADDSEFEINGVRELLPEVGTLLLPKRRPEEYRECLAGCGFFESLAISDEDKNRNKMYVADERRKQSAETFVDLTSYYRSLEMLVTISLADDISIPRIAQLTQKTNQFNLTAKRYTEGDIRRFVNSGTADVFCLRLQDRFGDFGLVGVCIVTYEMGKATIDTFLLSCRVLGRFVEDVFLESVVGRMQAKGCKQAIGTYIPAPKNEQVKDFYSKRCFKTIDSGSGQIVAKCNLQDFKLNIPGVFKQVQTEFVDLITS